MWTERDWKGWKGWTVLILWVLLCWFILSHDPYDHSPGPRNPDCGTDGTLPC